MTDLHGTTKPNHNRGVVLEPNPIVRSLPRLSITGIILTLVLLLAACGGDSPTAPPASGPTSTIAPTQTSPLPTTAPPPITPGPTAAPPTITPGPTTAPTTSPTLALTLELMSPEDGAGVEIDVIRVMGRTSVDAAVGVNGTPVEVSLDGSFLHDLELENGINLIEVVAANLSGETAFQEAAVFFISTAAGLPFTLFYPPDGLVVSDPNIPVFGGTRPDAVVGVNGLPVDLNSLGIFSASVTLEEGGNFIEVLATDIDGNVRFQTVAVFYLP